MDHASHDSEYIYRTLNSCHLRQCLTKACIWNLKVANVDRIPPEIPINPVINSSLCNNEMPSTIIQTPTAKKVHDEINSPVERFLGRLFLSTDLFPKFIEDQIIWNVDVIQ